VTRLLLDSGVFVDHLRGRRRIAPGTNDIHYSAVTRAELFAGRSTEERRVRRLLEPFIELDVDRSVAERAGRLRRSSAIRLPDALIAATALEHRLVLVTRNTEDFAAVRGLRFRPVTDQPG
jgi:predicted nucleic acid-binding protein